MYLSIRQTRDWGEAELVVRTTLPPATLASTVREALQADSAEPASQRFPDAATTGGQGGVAAAIPVCCRRVRAVRAGAGVAGDLRSDLVFGETARAGDRDPDGARSVGGAAAAEDLLQTLGLAAIGMTVGGVGVVGAGAGDGQAAVRRDAGDPVTFAAMVAVLGAVAAMAGWLPASRAARMDPMPALRAS